MTKPTSSITFQSVIGFFLLATFKLIAFLIGWILKIIGFLTVKTSELILNNLK